MVVQEGLDSRCGHQSFGRGLLTSLQPGAAFSSAPALYIADHDTAPPEGQVIKTDPSSLLIASMQPRKAKDDAKKKAAARSAADKGKRPAADAEGQQPSKRPATDGAGPSNTQDASGSGASVVPRAQAAFTRPQLAKKTIKDLQTILRAWGLPVGGRKDELVDRVLANQRGQQQQQT